MEFVTEKAPLLQALYFAQGIADRKATMPILANVLIRTHGDNRVMIAATDLSMTVSADISGDVQTEGGVTVSARHLYDLVKSIQSERIRIKQGEGGHVEVLAGKIHYKMVGLKEHDFPKLPESQKVQFFAMETSGLLELIRKTFFSISTDETRYHLNGALFECTSGSNGVARMVSTDGHRLSKCEHHMAEGQNIQPGILIPRRALGEVRRVLEGASSAVDIGIYMGHLFVRSKTLLLSVKLQEAQFPPYNQVIPKGSSRIGIVDRVALLDALKRISMMASDKTWGVKFSFSHDVLKIEADNPDLGHGEEELPLQYQGTPLVIGFNSKYLVELLSEMDTKSIRFECNGELDPGMLRPVVDEERPNSEYLGVVMPMRI